MKACTGLERRFAEGTEMPEDAFRRRLSTRTAKLWSFFQKTLYVICLCNISPFRALVLLQRPVRYCPQDPLSSLDRSHVNYSSPLCLGYLRSCLLWIDLLAVLVVPDSRWWCTISSSLSRSHTVASPSAVTSKHCGPYSASLWNIPNNLSVDGTRDAVLKLEVHLWYGILGEDGGIGNVT